MALRNSLFVKQKNRSPKTAVKNIQWRHLEE